MFDVLLIGSLLVFSFGFCYRLSTWFLKVMPFQNKVSGRGVVFLSGVLSSFSRRNFLSAFLTFFNEILCQKRLIANNLFRGLAHIFVSSGISILIVMHAMDGIILENLFSGYESTLNPFFFLRDFFGFLVFIGLLFFIIRRILFNEPVIKTSRPDFLILMMLLCLICSGFLLEGMKMTSVKEFSAMTSDYAGLDYEEEEVLALEAYWVEDFGLVSGRVRSDVPLEVIQEGIELHQSYCMECHSANKSAFGGYFTATLISPVAGFLDRINGVVFFYYIHILISFICLAIIPFSKLFHMIATPISLITRSVVKDKRLKFENRVTRKMLALDACTHCCVCNQNCSANMMYEQIQNQFILPSEKMQALKDMNNGVQLPSKSYEAFFQGLYLCTNCDRCTVACPSGIDLKEVWINVRENFVRQDQVKPYVLSNFSFLRGLLQNDLKDREYVKPAEKSREQLVPLSDPGDSFQEIDLKKKSTSFFSLLSETHTFSNCFGCQNCSTVCPVIKTYEHPEKELGLIPHQIMYCLGLGLMENASHSAMAWNCLSCYQCQEHCPQEVSVCDILFALKNNVFNKS